MTDLLILWRRIANNWLYLAGGVYTCALMGFGFYLQYFEHQEPCPLCMVQRAIFIAILAVFFIAAIHGPKRLGARLYAVLISGLSLAGIAVAVRHIRIQHLPADQVPACGPDLDYMLDTMPLARVLKELMHGSGECAAHGWTLFTLGIPEWSLLCYIGLGVWSILIALKNNASR